MIKTLQRAVVVTAALFALGPALAGVAHADPIEPPVFEYPCPETGCVVPEDPPTYQVACPPFCADEIGQEVVPICPPSCPDPEDPINPVPVEPICPPICPDEPQEVVPICPPICPDDDDGGNDGGPGENPGDEPTDEPGDEPTDERAPDDGGDQPQAGRLPHTGGPDLPLLLASGIGLIAAGGFGYLLVTRR